MAISEPDRCRAVAMSRGDAIYALRFELRNLDRAPIALPIHDPFTSFSVLATAGGKPLTVHQPALDIAVNPTIIRMPPGAAVTVRTPIRLRIAEEAEPGRERFIWTIAHRQGAVSLHVKLDLPAPFDGLCPLRFE